MKRNLFIAIEGCDGAGSSTQVGALKDLLNLTGRKAFETKEPTNNLVGGLIRGVLRKNWKIDPKGFQLLFAADRSHHLDDEILPTLQKGNIITDRYFFSTIAYGSLDADISWLKSLNSYFRTPDATFIIDVPPEVCIERIKASRSSMELFEEKEKLCRVQATYHILAKQFPGVYLIDGNRSKDEILKEIYATLKPYYHKNIIAISGPPGSGKGSFAEKLAEKISYTHYSIGEIRRKMAKEKGVPLAELNKIGEHEAYTDNDADAYMQKLAQEEDNFIVDGRLSYFFIPYALKIFLDVDPNEGAKRVFEAGRSEEKFKSIDEAKMAIEDRATSDARRYYKWYDIENVYSKSNFHYIIDTTKLSVDQVINKITDEILPKHEIYKIS
ncbi:dTMP kinase [Candidatus Woesearchaeota archaeon]|nr:dTMP kinase [Candidatus Woesearchaeota archaeon]